MTSKTQALLEEFEHLPADEKRAFTNEVLRRSLPFRFRAAGGWKFSLASSALFESLDQEDGNPQAR